MTTAPVRVARPEDAVDVGRLLQGFADEFGEPTPGASVLADRARRLIEADESVFLLVGDPPVGLAQLRFRPSVWSGKPDCYLEDLYVEQPARRRGHGREVLQHAIELARRRGAAHIELATGDTDVAARALYEAHGFRHTEVDADGTTTLLFYERSLDDD
jgi:GNAT superfamily N-acetyltransferase